MNKLEVKKLFWELVNKIEDCSDATVRNDAGVVERGIELPNGYSVMFGLDDGVVRIYDDKQFPINAFNEENETLLVLKELFEYLEI